MACCILATYLVARFAQTFRKLSKMLGIGWLFPDPVARTNAYKRTLASTVVVAMANPTMRIVIIFGFVVEISLIASIVYILTNSSLDLSRLYSSLPFLGANSR